jgi:hypothetical protein
VKKKIKLSRTGCLIALVVFVVLFAVLYLSTTAFPGFGAQGADFLRGIIGDQATAQLEMFIFQVQDSVHQVEYNLGLQKAQAPWHGITLAPSPVPTATLPPTADPPTPTSLPDAATAAPNSTPTPPQPTLTPTAIPWQHAPVTALGNLPGEGAWTPYISDGAGHTVAYRTFIQPDPKRPYTLVGIVAFDLSRLHLGFVLGTIDPKIKGIETPRRSGTIPAADFKPGVLLATFNGGFKGEHGAFGAMSGGVVAIPPRTGLATVAMYDDGTVSIGEWGKDIQPSSHILAWRQNCRLVVQEGEINPLVYVDSVEYWGANLNGATVTWRSGIGISPDGNTLYYFAGPSMKADILAQTMMAAGVKSGMQLDINNYWVHFNAVRYDGNQPLADPLFPDEMKADAARYLKAYSRDFFYVTLKNGPSQ